MKQGHLSMLLADATMEPMNALGKLVRAARENQGMRGIDLGVAIGRDGAYVSRLERGILKEVPDPATLGRLSDALDIPELRLLEAIGYRVRQPAPAAPPIDSRRAALIDLLERELTEADARVLEVTARAIIEERDARTVRDAEVYARLGPTLSAPARGQPVPAT